MARPPPPTPPHFIISLHEPVLRLFALVGRGAIHLKDLMVIPSYLNASYNTVSHEFSKLYCTIVNSALVDVSKSSYSLSWYVRRKAQRLSLLLYLPANSSLPECDCSFSFMFHQTAEMVLPEKINKKDYFLLRL